MAYIWQFTNGGNTYGPEHIVSGTLNDALYKECSFGNTVSRQLNMRLWNVTIDPTSPIVLSCKESSDAEWVAKGTYLVDSFSTSPYSEFSELTAFDAMLKSEVVYLKEGTWPSSQTDVGLATSIASTIGVTWNTANRNYYRTHGVISIDQSPNIGENGTTCRQILGTIAALRGGNWIINDNNELVLVPLFGHVVSASSLVYPTSAEYVIGDGVVSFDKSDAEPIVGIEFQANGGESVRYPSGLTDEEWEALDGRILYNNLPFMASQEAVDRVGEIYVAESGAAHGISYVPYKANQAYISPSIELGALVQIKDANVHISDRTLSISSLAPSTLSAETSRQVESFYPRVSPEVREARQKTEENRSAITILPSQIMSEVYTKGETDERISSQVTQTADALTISFDEKLGTAVGEANAYTQEQTEGLRTYFEFGSDGLTIGKSDSPFKTEISNTELAFTGESGEKAAWINANQLNIQEAVIPTDGDIQLKGSSGKWVQQVRNDHFQIRWVGN